MADFEELSFVIPGYTPETMPLDRLIEYLQQFAAVIGTPDQLHLTKIEKSSVAPTFKVSRPVAERATEEAERVQRGEGTKVQRAAFNRLRRYVRRDAPQPGRPALFRSQKKVVLTVPAAPEDTGSLQGIRQATQIDGKLVRIGGDGEYASMQLSDLQGGLITGFTVKHDMVKDLAQLIYEPIRVSGVGIWNRDEDGQWQLRKMEVQSYEALDDEPLDSMVDRLRGLKVTWPKNAIDALLAGREATA